MSIHRSVVVALIAFSIAIVSGRSSQAELKVGEKAPDFSLKASDGKTYSLSDFKGQPVWLTFWGSWCPPCRA